MPPEESLTPAERELESALAGLAPAAPAIDRDALMFQAGRAAARRGGLLWKAASAALAACLAVSLVPRPQPEPTVRAVYLPAPAKPGRAAAGEVSPPEAPPAAAARIHLPAGSYAKLCMDVVDHGVDVLDATASASAPRRPLTLRESLGRSDGRGIPGLGAFAPAGDRQ